MVLASKVGYLAEPPFVPANSLILFPINQSLFSLMGSDSNTPVVSDIAAIPADVEILEPPNNRIQTRKTNEKKNNVHVSNIKAADQV